MPDDSTIVYLASILDVSEYWLRTGEGEMMDPDTMIRQGYETLVDAIPHAVALLDTELRFLKVNAAYLETWDLSDEDITGRTMYEVFPDVSAEGRLRLARVVAGEPVYTGDPEPYPWKRADGRVYWSRLRMFPWHNEGGEVAGIVVMCATSLDVNNVPSLGILAPAEKSDTGAEKKPFSGVDAAATKRYDVGSTQGREDDMVITSEFVEAMGKGAQFIMEPAAFLLIARLMAGGKRPRIRVVVEDDDENTEPPKQ